MLRCLAALSWYVYPGIYTMVYGYAKIYGYAEVCGNAMVGDNAKVCSTADYMVFKNWWSSSRHFTWTA